MGEALITQVGVGGILALLILDRVFAFLRHRRNGTVVTSSAGEQSTEYWRQTNKDLMLIVVETTIAPILKAQTVILDRLETRSGTSYESQLKHAFMLEDIQKSVERLRLTSHANTDILQRLIDRSMRQETER